MISLFKNKNIFLTSLLLLLLCISCSSDNNTSTNEESDPIAEEMDDDDTQGEEGGEETTGDEGNDDTGEGGEETDNGEGTDEEGTGDEGDDTGEEGTDDEGTGDDEGMDSETGDEEGNDDGGEDTDEDGTADGSNLIFSDEFEGSALDESKWRYQRGAWNGSNVQNCYVDENTTVSDGTLKITAKYEPGHDCFNVPIDFTSGFVQTKDRVFWTYGYFEARVKVPASNSTWPAFWMSPQEEVYGAWPRSGEIDIFEIRGHNMTESSGNAHWGNSSGDRRQEKGVFEYEDATQWHVYAVEWTEGELNFYIDDEWYHTINNFRAPNATEHPGPFNIDFYIRLNMAVGGNFLSEPHNDAYQNIDQLPAVMEVDYVRVYSEKPD